MSGIGRASAFLASGTIVSRVLGFVKAFVLVQALGAIGTISGDAYATATVVPNSIYAVIGGGLLSAVLVPQIVRASRADDRGAAYINKLVTIALSVFVIVTVAATLSAPLLVDVLGARTPLATAFAYWSIPQIFFLGLYSVLGEVLNARRYFGPFTWAPVVNNVVGIATIVVFMAIYGADPSGSRLTEDWTPAMIALLAGGATLGIATQGLLLLFFWRRIGLKFRPDFAWRGVGLGSAGIAAGWTLGMLVMTQIAGIIETNVANAASGAGASVFALATAWLIFMLPHSVITVSLVTAFYTRMSEHAADNDLGSLRADVASALRAVALLLVLASAGVVTVAMPFARVFVPGFAESSQLAAVIIAYGVGLVPFSLLFVVQRTFYALGDTRTPFIFTAVQVVLVVSGVLASSLLPVDRIAVGIAATVSAATFVQLVVAAGLLYRRIGWAGHGVPRSLLIDMAAVIPAGAAGAGLLSLTGATSPSGFAMASAPTALVSVAAIAAGMTLVYVGALALLRSPDLALLAGAVRRLRKR